MGERSIGILLAAVGMMLIISSTWFEPLAVPGLCIAGLGLALTVTAQAGGNGQ